MTYAEFKENFLPEFLNIKSFAAKIRYANERLSRIGSGTGRIVYDIDGERVFKLAKNAKGIAQNEAEAGTGYYRDTQHIVTEVFDGADDDSWLISEKAKSVNEKRIKELTGIPSLSDLFYFLKNFTSQNSGRGKIFNQKKEIEEFFWENEFAQDVQNLVANYSQHVGDMGRPSTYGEVLRDGQPTIVLTDYGLNDEVYNTHYDSDRKQKHRMYELYGFQDGNDDILSDIGNVGANERYGMWALKPYNVSDGPGVINEKFVDFVLKRNKYPKKPIKSLPYLSDCFHECVNNIKETLNSVDNKKQFFNNLLELQQYLIEQNYYDRDPLMKEEYVINEDIPPVEHDALDDRAYAIELAQAVADKLNLGGINYLGYGGNGVAFEVNNKVVLKLTIDLGEADAAFIVLRNGAKYLAEIYNIYKVVDTETNKAVFAILEENIVNKPVDKFLKMEDDINKISPEYGYQDLLSGIRKRKYFDYNKGIEYAKTILTANPEANVSQADRKAAYEHLVGILNIRQELIDLGIKSTDYIAKANLGYSNGVLKFFDVGGHITPEPNVGKNVITLPETVEEPLKEDYPRDRADAVAAQVGKKLGVEPHYLAHGFFGVAYDIGNNKILKITSDNSEAAENLRLIGKPLKYIAQPYNVYKIGSTTNPDFPKTFAIVLEKLKTDAPYFKRMYDRLDYVFKTIFDTNYKDVIEAYLYGHQFDHDIDKSEIDHYFKKNSKDADFFFGVLRIAEELDKYGVETAEYYNADNLGYKKSGALGLFDVGFGNGWLQPDNPEKIDVNVDEDGSSKFSTDNEFGQDGFPPYNQGDDNSPMVKNDLDANTAMYGDDNMDEDLEYNHVKGDATDDEYELTEDRKKAWVPGSKAVTVKKKCRLGGLPDGTSVACNQGDINNLEFTPLTEDKTGLGVGDKYAQKFGVKSDFDKFEKDFNAKQNEEGIIYKDDKGWGIVKNPKSLTNIGNSVRGIITVDGDLYLELYSDKIHINIVGILHEKGLVSKDFYDALDDYIPSEYLTVQRDGNSNDIVVGESNDAMQDDAMMYGNWRDTLKVPSKEEVLPYFQKFMDVAKRKNPRINFINEHIAVYRRAKYIKEDIIKEVVSLDLPVGDIQGGFATYEIMNNGQVVGEMELMDRDNKYLILDKIIIEKEFRGAGYANDAMRLLFDYADKQDKIITLTPDSVWGANKNKLQKWYQSLGFIMNKGKNKDFETMQLMYRLPNSHVPMNEANIMQLNDLPFKSNVENLGGKIYSVGGAVRDEFLGKESKDLDILVTGIPMDRLEKLLSRYGRVDAVGKSFGVLKFKPQGASEEIDVAIPRTEFANDEGGHKGFDVTANHELPLEKDLERRDFTINAIAKDIDGNIIDPFGGQKDLQNKTIRVVNPEAFSDDPLRMLRAVQFASRFGFEIEPKTMEMIRANAQRIKEIPAERILTEFEKIVTKGDMHRGAVLLRETGLFKNIFGFDLPDVNFEGAQTMGEFIFIMTRSMQDPAEYFKSNLKGDNNTYKEIKALQHAYGSADETNRAIARTAAHNAYVTWKPVLQSKILPEVINSAAQELLTGRYPKSFKEMAVNGNDLKSLGYKQGEELGDMLKGMLKKIYADEIRNDREELLPLAQQGLGNLKESWDDYENPVWDVNGEMVDVEFFADEYDIWNTQGGKPGYEDPSHESVLEFLQNNYEDFSKDERLKKKLYWTLTDRDLLTEREEKVEYGALMLFLEVPVWEKITSVIKKDDIYEKDGEFGIETEPHVTILYGFHANVTADNVFDLYKENFELKPIEIGVEGISTFENEEFDVVKMDVSSKILTKMNSVMRELPSTVTFPKYHAHITLAYVKKGHGKDYIKAFEKNRILVGNELVFSTKKEKHSKLKLDGNGVLKENKEQMKKVSYSAVVLDNKSRATLIKVFHPMIPEGWKIYAHHMTIKMGALDDGSQEQKDMHDGEIVTLDVVDYAIDDKVMAVGVKGYHTTNAKPHVTIAVNTAEGGKPFLSNKLTEWRPIGFPIELTGKVSEEV